MLKCVSGYLNCHSCKRNIFKEKIVCIVKEYNGVRKKERKKNKLYI